MPIIIITILILLTIIVSRKMPPQTYSNWNSYLEGLQCSSEEYYAKLQETLMSKKVHGIRFEKVMLNKRGALSSKREYMRITFEDVTHDISFYPFALGTYASSWSYTTVTGIEELVLIIPVLGKWLHSTFFPYTYYIADSVAMFQLLVHEAQIEIIDGLLAQKGLRKLSETQKTLKTKSVFDR